MKDRWINSPWLAKKESPYTKSIEKYYFICVFTKNMLGDWGWGVRDKNKEEGGPEEFIPYPEEGTTVESFEQMLSLSQL